MARGALTRVGECGAALWRLSAALRAACILAALSTPQEAGQGEPVTPSDAARSFLASLDATLRAKANLAYESSNRTVWAYTPGSRQGVAWNDLNDDQRRYAQSLLKSVLSPSGLKREAGIRTLEGVLRDLEGARRDPGYYVFTVFGEPAEKGRWAFRYEGHHLSLNFTYVDGNAISTTPQFFGANPAEVESGPHKGLRVLAAEEDLARELLASFDDGQLKLAVIAESAPADIATSNSRQAAIQAGKGIAYSLMNPSQRKLLQGLVRIYAEVQPEPIAAGRLKRIEEAGWDKVKFAWMGGAVKGAGFYYRVQGPRFLIEFDDTQNRANHIHSVWRDFSGDFGEDALARHYATAPHRRRR